jgi:putative ABC transport system ATP-binding protein
VDRPASPLFRLQGVEVERNGRRVLGLLDLTLPARGPIVVAGPSGSGKSSLLRLLNRLDVPSAGTIELRGDDLAAADPLKVRRRVAMVFQRPVVFEGTVLVNLREAATDLSRDEASILLVRVGLDPELLDRDARDLSGGEAQRMALARSLTTQPDVVLFDEPTSSLDTANALRIEELAQSLQDDGVSVIWVTHDLDQLERLAAWIVVLIDGTLAQEGPASEVLAHPTDAVAAFLSGGAS